MFHETARRRTTMRDVQAGQVLEWFLELEERLSELMRHVPYSENTEEVSLPRAAGIILEAGSLIDTVFRETMPTQASRGSLTMRDYRPHFEDKFHLSNLRSLMFYWPPKYLVPFSGWQAAGAGGEQQPSWWRAYSDMKHSRISSLPQATLGNAVLTLAALHQVMSQTSPFWEPLLRREMIDSNHIHVANYVHSLTTKQPWASEVVTVESALFSTTLGSKRFPERIADLRSWVSSSGGKRLRRFLGVF